MNSSIFSYMNYRMLTVFVYWIQACCTLIRPTPIVTSAFDKFIRRRFETPTPPARHATPWQQRRASFSPPSPPLTLSSLFKLGRTVTPCHVDRLLTVLIRRRKHRLLASIATQALANSLSPTPRTHLIAASALLDSARPREAARRLALASCSASRGLWNALLRRACTGHGEPRWSCYPLLLMTTVRRFPRPRTA
jgi:hypothetical protein